MPVPGLLSMFAPRIAAAISDGGAGGLLGGAALKQRMVSQLFPSIAGAFTGGAAAVPEDASVSLIDKARGWALETAPQMLDEANARRQRLRDLVRTAPNVQQYDPVTLPGLFGGPNA